MDTTQPEALRLADELCEAIAEYPEPTALEAQAAAELLRQHAENETLRAGYAAARLEVESLKAQLHAAKQINAAQFRLLAASIPGSALRASHGQAPAGAGEQLTRERVKEIVRGAGYDQCGIPDTERAAFINGLRHGEHAHGIKGGHYGTE